MPLQNQPFVQLLRDSGQPYAGALAYYYYTGTLNEATVYQDGTLFLPHEFPIIADASGRFPAVFLDPAIIYRVIYKTSGGTVLEDIDAISGSSSISTNDINDGAITTEKLATNAVNTAKIQNQAVSNAKLAAMPAKSIKGNDGASVGDAKDLSVGDMYSLLGTFGGDAGTGGTPGFVPAPPAGSAAAGKVALAAGGFGLVDLSKQISVVQGTGTSPRYRVLGNVMECWGVISGIATDATQTVNFPNGGFAAGSTIYDINVSLTPIYGFSASSEAVAQLDLSTSVTSTSITVRNKNVQSSPTIDVSWRAIGPK